MATTDGEQRSTDDAAHETPYTRLRDLFSYAFSKAEYGDPNVRTSPLPLKKARRGRFDDQVPAAPAELREFGSNTVFVMAGGLTFGGIMQWWKERQAPPPSIPTGYSKAERAKFIGEIKTRQLVRDALRRTVCPRRERGVRVQIRILNSTLRGGLWCGWMGALYFGVEGLSAYARQTEDPWNTVMGAWACGSVFGFSGLLAHD